MINYDSFDWGITSENRKFVADVTMEIFQKQNYEKFFEVEKGDTVVDIGASVGPFAYSIMHKKPKEIICLEPQAELFKTLKKNVLSNENTKVTLLKTGISDHDGVQTMDNVYCNGTEYGTRTLVMGMSLTSLVNCCDIEKIDFLKVDCEGYEYALFSDINIDWVFKNVRKIACEFHIFTENQKEKFRDFRDFIIKSFFSKKVKVVSIDGVDITWDLYNEHFIDYYKCFYLFIDNREVKSTVLEITTAMPEKGCPVDCVFCPQGVLTHAPYFGDRILSLENFRKVLNKLPNEVRITFAGFTEPFLNKDTIHMISAAYDKGHIISIFTTGIGLHESDYDDFLQIISYSSEPNGGFVLHLPDALGHSNHNITDRYLRLLEKIKNCPPQNFYPVCMGEVHPKIKPIFEKAIVYQMWSRAGNLIKEMQYKPRLINLKDKFGAIYHTEGKMGCNCLEGLNHNVLLPNGNVVLCCMDYGLENILGNLFINEYSKILPKENSNFKLCKFCENGVITQH